MLPPSCGHDCFNLLAKTMEPDAASGAPGLRRLHPLSPIFSMFSSVRAARNLVQFALPAVLVIRRLGPGLPATLALAATGLLVWRLAAWWTTTYAVDETHITMHTGILNRRTRVVPAERVQQIEVVQSLLHRIARVAAVRIELVGASADEGDVRLSVVSAAEAQHIRSKLDAARLQAVGTAALPPPERTLLALTSGDLIRGSLTGGGLLAAPAGIAVAFSLVDDFGINVPDLPVLGILAKMALGIVAAGFIVGITVFTALRRHHGWTMTETRGEIRVTRGLTELRTSLVPVSRIQMLTVTANPLRRALGLGSLDIRTAATLDAKDRQGVGSSDNSVPVARAVDLDRLVAVLLPTVGEWPNLDRAPSAALWRAILRVGRWFVPPAIFAAWLFWPTSRWLVLCVPAAMGVSAVVGRLSYLAMWHGSTRDVIDIRRGWLGRSRRLVPVSKIQSTSITQSPFQRRSGLATVALDLVLAQAVARDVSFDQALTLARRCRGVSLD